MFATRACLRFTRQLSDCRPIVSHKILHCSPPRDIFHSPAIRTPFIPRRILQTEHSRRADYGGQTDYSGRNEHGGRKEGGRRNLLWLSVCGMTVLASTAVCYCLSQTDDDTNKWNEKQLYLDPSEIGPTLAEVEGTWIPTIFVSSPQKLEAVRSFAMRPDDIVVASFPKSGTTWVQYIIFRIKDTSSASNQSSYPKYTTTASSNPTFPATEDRLDTRFPFLEYFNTDLEELAGRPSPRFIKIHLPYHLLPRDIYRGNAKVIYVARNAKDVCVSYFHFTRLDKIFKGVGTFEQIFDLFISGRVIYGPWLEHVKGFWEQRHRDNILFITYEELHKDRAAVVRRIAEFLSTSLSPRQVDEIVAATSFDVMKDNEFVNYSWAHKTGIFRDEKIGGKFIRKGIVGDWRNYLSPQMSDAVDRECIQPLKQLGLSFD